MLGYMIGTVDLGAIDLGNIEGRDRGALARVLGAKSYRDEQGRWRFAGGVVDGVRLDHPTVLRVLGEPLEACGPVRWEPLRDDVRGPEMPAPADGWEPGPAVLDWLNGLTDAAEFEQAAALINEHMTGAVAEMVEGITPAVFQRLTDSLRGLIMWDAAGLDDIETAPADDVATDTPADILNETTPRNTGNLYNSAAVFLTILTGTQSRRAGAQAPAPAAVKPRYRLHLDGTFEHLSGPALDIPAHQRYTAPADGSDTAPRVSAPDTAPVYPDTAEYLQVWQAPRHGQAVPPTRPPCNPGAALEVAA